MSGPSKIDLRAAMRNRRAALPTATRDAAGRLITRHLLASPQISEATAVMVYASAPQEVPTRPLIDALLAAGKDVYLPRQSPGGLLEIVAVHADDTLVTGPHGILEPSGPAIDPGQIDVVIVPGVGFTASGTRLGNGGGAYDRLLAAMSATKIGLAFACQILAAIPTEPHDVPMDVVVTEEGGVRRNPSPGR